MLNEKKLAWYARHNHGGAGGTNNQGLAAAQNYAYFKNLKSQLFPNVSRLMKNSNNLTSIIYLQCAALAA